MQKFVVKKSKSGPPPPSAHATVLQDVSMSSTGSNKSTVAEYTTTTSNDLPVSVPTKTVTASQSSASPSPSSTGTTQVKMSGYLKKKRNKMGGWRKLWFVLQNQLLLSYSSKEDYEKKLAPFKDVLNLVPGTTVRPTSGPRFIIETSSYQIYTYRCDSNKVCSEWVTALVESLAPHSNGSDVTIPIVSSKFHFSMENLPKSIVVASSSSALSSPASSFMSSRSCDSLCRAKYAKQLAKLPVAQNTARLLERVSQSNGKKNEMQPKRIPGKVPNFRLHQNNLHVSQSFEVHRINRMFNNSNSSNCSSTDGSSKSEQPILNNNKRVERNYCNANDKDTKANDGIDAVDVEISNENVKFLLDKNSSCELFTMDSLNRDNVSGNCSPTDHFQHISLGGSSLGSSTTSTTSKHSSNATAELRASISKMFQAQTEDVNLITEYDDEASGSDNGSKSSACASAGAEPIYAVVNLKNKYARRARKNEFDEDVFVKERPNSFHVISGDYEEVLHLNVCGTGAAEDENIYEPINIPNGACNPLWRYFSKINIDAFVEMTRWKRDHSKDDCTTSAFSDIRKRFGHHRKSLKNRMKKLYNRSNSDPINVAGNDADEIEHGSSSATRDSDNSRFRKREKHIFGSMLKKSGTSPRLGESTPRKKLLQALESVRFESCTAGRRP